MSGNHEAPSPDWWFYAAEPAKPKLTVVGEAPAYRPKPRLTRRGQTLADVAALCLLAYLSVCTVVGIGSTTHWLFR